MSENSRQAAQESRDLAWELLKVNSNLAGGAAKWKAIFRQLRDAMGPLDSEMQADVLPLMDALERRVADRRILMTTLIHWRPYALLILKSLGVQGPRIQKEQRDFRISDADMRRAQDAAAEEAGLEPPAKRIRSPQKVKEEASETRAALPAPPVQPPKRSAPLLALGNGSVPAQPRSQARLDQFFSRSPACAAQLKQEQQDQERGAPPLKREHGESPPLLQEDGPRAPPPPPRPAPQKRKRGRPPKEQPPAAASSAGPAEREEAEPEGDVGGDEGPYEDGDHYATLGVSRDATSAVIYKAYRKQALKKHPDKGGSKEAFQALTAAFDTLTDAEKRLAYDTRCAQWQATPAARSHAPELQDEGEDEEGPEEQAERVAKAAWAHLLISQKEQWEYHLRGINTETLTKLHKLLTKGQERAPVATAGEGSAGGSGRGINKSKSGSYWVQVGWRCFKVRTLSKITTLDQALRVHVALTVARESALRRYGALERNLKKHGFANKDIDDCPPMTHAELMAVILEEPGVVLSFATDLHGPPRFQSNWTTSLDQAVHFRVMMRGFFAEGLPKGEVYKKLKDEFKIAAQKDNADRTSLGRDVVARVSAEVRRRGAEEPAVPQAPAPAVPAPELLAIKEVSAAAEAEKWKEAYENEKKGRMQALEDHHRTEELMRAKMDRVEEERRTAEDREQVATRKKDQAESRVQDLQDRLICKCEEAAQEREEKTQAQAKAAKWEQVAVEREQEARRPTIFSAGLGAMRRATPWGGAPAADTLNDVAVQAAQRENHRRGLHVGATALEPSGSYGLLAPRRAVLARG